MNPTDLDIDKYFRISVLDENLVKSILLLYSPSQYVDSGVYLYPNSPKNSTKRLPIVDNEYAFNKFKTPVFNRALTTLHRSIRSFEIPEDIYRDVDDNIAVKLLDFLRSDQTLLNRVQNRAIKSYCIDITNIENVSLTQLFIDTLYEELLLVHIGDNSACTGSINDKRLSIKQLRTIELHLQNKPSLLEQIDKLLFNAYRESYNYIAKTLFERYLSENNLCSGCRQLIKEKYLDNAFDAVLNGATEFFERNLYIVSGKQGLCGDINKSLVLANMQCTSLQCINYPRNIAVLEIAMKDQDIASVFKSLYTSGNDIYGNFLGINIYVAIDRGRHISSWLFCINGVVENLNRQSPVKLTMRLIDKFPSHTPNANFKDVFLLHVSASQHDNKRGQLKQNSSIDDKKYNFISSYSRSIEEDDDNMLGSDRYIELIASVLAMKKTTKTENSKIEKQSFAGVCVFHPKKKITVKSSKTCGACVVVDSRCGCKVEAIYRNPTCTVHNLMATQFSLINSRVTLPRVNAFTIFLAFKYIEFKETITSAIGNVKMLTHQDAIAKCLICGSGDVFITMTEKIKLDIEISCESGRACGKEIEKIFFTDRKNRRGRLLYTDLISLIGERCECFPPATKIEPARRSTSGEVFAVCTEHLNDILEDYLISLPKTVKTDAVKILSVDYLRELSVFRASDEGEQILKLYYISRLERDILEKYIDIGKLPRKDVEVITHPSVLDKYSTCTGDYTLHNDKSSLENLFEMLHRLSIFQIEVIDGCISVRIPCPLMLYQADHEMHIQSSKQFCKKCFLVNCEICRLEFVRRRKTPKTSYIPYPSHKRLSHIMFSKYAFNSFSDECPTHRTYIPHRAKQKFIGLDSNLTINTSNRAEQFLILSLLTAYSTLSIKHVQKEGSLLIEAPCLFEDSDGVDNFRINYSDNSQRHSEVLVECSTSSSEKLLEKLKNEFNISI